MQMWVQSKSMLTSVDMTKAVDQTMLTVISEVDNPLC